MRVAIVGSRSIADKGIVFEAIDEFLADKGQVTLVSGGASGVDQLVREYAEAKGIDFILFEPYHKLSFKTPFKTEYFFVRNKQIVRNADIVYAIWDGVSNGTRHTIEYAQKVGVPVVIDVAEEVNESTKRVS